MMESLYSVVELVLLQTHRTSRQISKPLHAHVPPVSIYVSQQLDAASSKPVLGSCNTSEMVFGRPSGLL